MSLNPENNNNSTDLVSLSNSNSDSSGKVSYDAATTNHKSCVYTRYENWQKDPYNFIRKAQHDYEYGYVLNPKHQKDIVEDSGVDLCVAFANITSTDHNIQIAKSLNRSKWTDGPGWECKGIDFHTGKLSDEIYCFKPDTPYKGREGDSPRKYLNPSKVESNPTKRTYDAFLLQVPGLPELWKIVYKNKHIRIVIVEGVKKALCLLSRGIVAIAIPGVGMWHKPQQIEEFVENLKVFFDPERVFDIAYDADYKTKNEVKRQLFDLCSQLKKHNKQVNIVSWDIGVDKEYKGVDDLIVKHPDKLEAFREALRNAVPYSGLVEDMAKVYLSGKLPTKDVLCKELVDKYYGLLWHRIDSDTWVSYGDTYDGKWDVIHPKVVKQKILALIENKKLTGYDDSYINSVYGLLTLKLGKDKWEEVSPKHYLPHLNGVLELSTSKLLPHNPEYYFSWILPREFRPEITNWTSINSFLDHLSNGSESVKEVLICWCKAILTGQYKLQKVLVLSGQGGTGKGTFFRLCKDLLGKENVWSTDLKTFCNNSFEPSNVYKKRLVQFPEEEKVTGDSGMFKRLTGEDSLRYERKGKDATNFEFDGLSMIGTNKNLLGGESPSAWLRRAINIECNNRVKKTNIRDLETDFQSELGAFTNYLLSIPGKRVEQVLRDSGEVTEISSYSWELLCRANSIAAWVNDNIIFDAKALSRVGKKKDDLDTLWGDYYNYCLDTGRGNNQLGNFKPGLLEVINTIMGINTVKESRNNSTRGIEGIRLRNAFDSNIPTYADSLVQHQTVTMVTIGDNASDNLKPLPCMDSDNGDNFLPNSIGHSTLQEKEASTGFQSGCGVSVVTDSEPIQGEALSGDNALSLGLSPIMQSHESPPRTDEPAIQSPSQPDDQLPDKLAKSSGYFTRIEIKDTEVINLEEVLRYFRKVGYSPEHIESYISANKDLYRRALKTPGVRILYRNPAYPNAAPRIGTVINGDDDFYVQIHLDGDARTNTQKTVIVQNGKTLPDYQRVLYSNIELNLTPDKNYYGGDGWKQ